MSQPTSGTVRKPSFTLTASRVEYLILLKTVQKLILWRRAWPRKQYRAVVDEFLLKIEETGPGTVRLTSTRGGGSFPLILNGEYAQRLWCFLTKQAIKPRLADLNARLEELQPRGD